MSLVAEPCREVKKRNPAIWFQRPRYHTFLRVEKHGMLNYLIGTIRKQSLHIKPSIVIIVIDGKLGKRGVAFGALLVICKQFAHFTFCTFEFK